MGEVVPASDLVPNLFPETDCNLFLLVIQFARMEAHPEEGVRQWIGSHLTECEFGQHGIVRSAEAAFHT